MRVYIFWILLISFSLLTTSCSLIQTDDSRARQDFVRHFQSAQQNHDLEKLLELYCWDGVEVTYQRLVRLGLQTEIQYDILKVSIVLLVLITMQILDWGSTWSQSIFPYKLSIFP